MEELLGMETRSLAVPFDAAACTAEAAEVRHVIAGLEMKKHNTGDVPEVREALDLLLEGLVGINIDLKNLAARLLASVPVRETSAMDGLNQWVNSVNRAFHTVFPLVNTALEGYDEAASDILERRCKIRKTDMNPMGDFISEQDAKGSGRLLVLSARRMPRALAMFQEQAAELLGEKCIGKVVGLVKSVAPASADAGFADVGFAMHA